MTRTAVSRGVPEHEAEQVASGREARGRPGRSGRRLVPESGQRRPEFLYFLLAGLVSLAVVAIGGLIASRLVGRDMAVDEIRHVGESLAYTIAEPELTAAIAAGDQEAIDEMDTTIRGQVLPETAVRVKLWDETGRILYSDEPALIGESFPLPAHEREAFESNEAIARVTDLDEPSNRLDNGFGKLLEVYVPVETATGERLVFESYFAHDAVDDHSREMWEGFVPIILVTVAVLGGIHFPLAWTMTRRLKRSQQNREQLLRRAIEASNLEDRRIATELHDGVVQELAATSFGLAAVDDMVRSGDEDKALDLVNRSAESVRASMLALRTLVVDIYPPNLRDEGLEGAVESLLESAANAGLTTSLDARGVPELPPELELLAYRTAREGIQNAVKHASADEVHVTLSHENGRFVMEITDNGSGFVPENEPESDHLGLRLLASLAEDVGARFDIVSVLGQGTTLRLETGP